MSTPRAEQPVAEDPDLERRIADYLLSHPTFFERNPDLLAAIQVPHLTGSAVSLIEQQVRVLRKQLESERGRLTHLISRAREYEALATRLHGLILQLMSVSNAEHLCQLIREAMIREFRAEAVALKLFPLTVADSAEQDPLTLAFRDFIDRDHTLCGPLRADKAMILFGETGADIHAAALVPIRAGTQSGVLAIGSQDPERFNPDMGTDFLDRLGEIVSQRLRSIPLEPCCQP